MQLGKNLMGKPIISIYDGRQLGTVEEFYLDSLLRFVAGVRFSRDDYADDDQFWMVKRGNVRLFGFDVILVTNAKFIIKESQVASMAKWSRRDALKGRMVYASDGAQVGIIEDVMFDKKGRVILFKLSEVFVEGPVAEAQAIARNTVIDTGRKTGIVTIDLPKAEQQILNATQDE